MFRAIKNEMCTLLKAILYEHCGGLNFALGSIFQKLSSIEPQKERNKKPSINQQLNTKQLKKISLP
jgi:hypothetical protein